MRKKLREIMDKEEGFTLVELLAVIVILGIILAIAIPSIGGVINKAQSNADAAEVQLVEDAARLYYIAEKDGKGNHDITIEEDLIPNYLEQTKDGNVLKGTVKITNTAGVIKYDSTVDSSPKEKTETNKPAETDKSR